jgi:hypothetical protein
MASPFAIGICVAPQRVGRRGQLPIDTLGVPNQSSFAAEFGAGATRFGFAVRGGTALRFLTKCADPSGALKGRSEADRRFRLWVVCLVRLSALFSQEQPTGVGRA